MAAQCWPDITNVSCWGCESHPAFGPQLTVLGFLLDYFISAVSIDLEWFRVEIYCLLGSCRGYNE